MAIERIIGIDFGTSTSVIRVKRYEDGKPVGEKLETKEVNFSDLGTTVPTLIQKKDDDESIVYYGYEAQQKRKKTTTYHGFKVDLESSDPEKRALARKLTEEFFCYLAKTYQAQSKGGYLGDPSDKERTIVSYPVKWSEETRQFMVAAAQKAGFPNVTGMDEARAAIQAVTVMSEDHLRKNGLLINGEPSNILLIDMGAGTTDLVLCRYTPGMEAQTEILSTWPKVGDILFGGREVDSLLQNFFRGMMDEETANLVFKRVGRDKFKTWKERTVSPALEKHDSVTDFEPLDNEIEMDYCLDRAAFEKCLEEYLKQLPRLISGCIDNSKIKASDVDLVILTGGHSQWYFAQEMLASKMPQYGKLELAKITTDPSRIVQIARPQETVALGLVYSRCSIIFVDNILALVKRNEKYGYINQKGEEVIPCIWDYANDFQDGLARVKGNGKNGYIDCTGTEIFACKWDYAMDFQNGLALVKRNEKYGYINQKGEEVIPCIWDGANDFQDGLACVKRNGKYGYIDRTGTEILACKWGYAMDFQNGLALVKRNEKYGYINQRGEEVTPCIWDDANNFHDGLARVKRNEKYGYINQRGEEVTPCIWDDANDFQDGLACIQRNERYGYIDQTGVKVIPCIWDDAHSFSEGLAKIKRNGKYGFIDRAGVEIIPCQWDSVGNFYEGLARVEKNNKCGYINRKGEEIIPCVWEIMFEGYETQFHNGFAVVKKDSLYQYVDKTGGTIPIRWAWKKEIQDNLVKGMPVVATLFTKKINILGKVIADCEFDWVDRFSNGLARAKKNGKYGFIDTDGNVVIDCCWDYAARFQNV